MQETLDAPSQRMLSCKKRLKRIYLTSPSHTPLCGAILAGSSPGVGPRAPAWMSLSASLRCYGSSPGGALATLKRPDHRHRHTTAVAPSPWPSCPERLRWTPRWNCNWPQPLNDRHRALSTQAVARYDAGIPVCATGRTHLLRRRWQTIARPRLRLRSRTAFLRPANRPAPLHPVPSPHLTLMRRGLGEGEIRNTGAVTLLALAYEERTAGSPRNLRAPPSAGSQSSTLGPVRRAPSA